MGADGLAFDGGAPRDGEACLSWPAANVDVCAGTPAPGGDLVLDGVAIYEYVTDTDVWTPSPGPAPSSALLEQAAGPELRVLVVRNLVVAGTTTLAVRGERPLLLIVHGDATLEGTIVAGSGRDSSICAVAGTGGPSGGSDGGGGGGGGGGFGGAGGAGGSGDTNDGDAGGASGAGAAIRGNPEIVPLRGGCPGGPGGRLGNSGTGGLPGRGGGALQISALGNVQLSGRIEAPGEGGSGGTGSTPGNGGRGGGGAGSGGAIVIEGAEVSVSGRVCANGGAGGEGQSGTTNGGDGEAGQCDDIAAQSPDASTGGDGGDGGHGGTPAGAPGATGADGGGGGGGGGGVGRIRLWQRSGGTPAVSGTVTPDPQLRGP